MQLCAHNQTFLREEEHWTTTMKSLTQQEPEEEHAVAASETKVSEWEVFEKVQTNRGKKQTYDVFLEAVC